MCYCGLDKLSGYWDHMLMPGANTERTLIGMLSGLACISVTSNHVTAKHTAGTHEWGRIHPQLKNISQLHHSGYCFIQLGRCNWLQMGTWTSMMSHILRSNHNGDNETKLTSNYSCVTPLANCVITVILCMISHGKGLQMWVKLESGCENIVLNLWLIYMHSTFWVFGFTAITGENALKP